MSRENPVLRPFDNLELFEDFASKLILELVPPTGSFDCHAAGSVLVDSVDLRGLGLKIKAQFTDDEIEKACKQLGIDVAELDLIFVADAGFLKERVVIRRVRLGDLKNQDWLIEPNQPRPSALMDKRHGYVIGAYIVLRTDLKPVPLRPWRRGTVIASSFFRVRPTEDFGGLEPEPLTSEVAAEHDLSTKTHHFVLIEGGELLALDSLRGNVRVFLNEDLYLACSKDRNNLTVLLMRTVAVNALIQITLKVSEELRAIEDLESLEGDPPMVIRLIQSALSNATPKLKIKSHLTLLETIRNEPERVAAALSSVANYSSDWLKIVETFSNIVSPSGSEKEEAEE